MSIHIAKEHPPQIHCDEYDLMASSTHDMEDHVNLKHKVEELFSCIHSEFDKEDIAGNYKCMLLMIFMTQGSRTRQ